MVKVCQPNLKWFFYFFLETPTVLLTRYVPLLSTTRIRGITP